VKPIPAAGWRKAIAAMAAEAAFSAKLLNGQMPEDIETAFAFARLSLLPESLAELETECSCPDWSNPCKHIAAVYYLLGEQFDADPFLIFRLRGKNKNEIIAMLRARRAAPETSLPAGSTAPRPDRSGKASPGNQHFTPLDKSLDRYWESPDPLENFPVRIQAPPVDAAPVKRFGAPGFWRGKQDFVEVFSSAYRSVTEAGLALVNGAQEK
jgi:uncharacterized Zn finger protein